MVSARIARVPQGVPVVLAGDFNALSGKSRSYEWLTGEGGLRDTWHAAAMRSEEDADSFNDFRDLGYQIILFNRSTIVASLARVNGIYRQLMQEGRPMVPADEQEEERVAQGVVSR